MPRRPRIGVPGEIYHVTQHGMDDRKIFRDDDDRVAFLRLLRDELVRSQWTCLAYALMTTHFHMLIELHESTLSSGAQRLNGRYAQRFNLKHRRRGHLFERRFRDVWIEDDAHRYEATRYIHLNPLRANLCAKPEDYRWTDYGSTIGRLSADQLVDPRRTLELWGADLDVARARYATFVHEPDLRVRRGQTRVRPRLERTV